MHQNQAKNKFNKILVNILKIIEELTDVWFWLAMIIILLIILWGVGLLQ